jgi:hypothetical protein
MPEKIKADYYIRRKKKLLALFQEDLKVARELFLEKFDEEKVKSLIADMIEQYNNILPEAQYVGGNKNPFTFYLIGAVGTFAIIRVLEKEGMPYREIGEFTFRYYENINNEREANLKKVGQSHSDQIFTPDYIQFMKEFAKKSQEETFPGDWVLEFIDGDGKPFTYGYNFSQCGSNELAKKLGLEKYMPFICLGDFAEATAGGFGFTRTQTLSNGAPICDHRYIKGGSTPRAWPPETVKEFKNSS